MTHPTYPVLASLALLGACSYEVTLWSSGGESGTAFDAAKIGELVKQVARANLGEPSAVRCPPRIQFVPRDRYTCEFDVEGATYEVAIRHGVWMTANASMSEPAMGFEPLAQRLEAYYAEDEVDVDCRGVVVSRARPTGFCPVDSNHGVIVRLVGDELKANAVEWQGDGLPW